MKTSHVTPICYSWMFFFRSHCCFWAVYSQPPSCHPGRSLSLTGLFLREDCLTQLNVTGFLESGDPQGIRLHSAHQLQNTSVAGSLSMVGNSYLKGKDLTVISSSTSFAQDAVLYSFVQLLAKIVHNQVAVHIVKKNTSIFFSCMTKTVKANMRVMQAKPMENGNWHQCME